MGAGSNWIKSSVKPANMSPLGEKVADLLDDVFSGIYHLDTGKLQKVDWGNDHHIAVQLYYQSLSTFDSPHLTWLVVLCHDRLLRMEVHATTFNTLELVFHQRGQREGDISKRMPTMEQHISGIRKYFPFEEKKNSHDTF